jgi:hypothetical protein
MSWNFVFDSLVLGVKEIVMAVIVIFTKYLEI